MTTDDMAPTLATALAFAKHGIASFACWWPLFAADGTVTCACGRLCDRIGKHPHGRLAPKGCHSATTDTGILKHQFGYLCPEANIAVHAAGLVIVDVDPRHNGHQSFSLLEFEHGFPKTWRCLSGGGGHHDYYRAPDGVVVKNVVAEHYKPPNVPPLGVGIDIRSKGGYIVAPPSLHESGRRYAWSVDHHPKDTPLADAPPWLIERLRADRDPPPRSSSGAAGAADHGDDLAALVENECVEYKDMTCARIAGLLAWHHLDRRIINSMMQNWNACKVRPPKLRWQQVERIVGNVCDREADRVLARQRKAEQEKQGN